MASHVDGGHPTAVEGGKQPTPVARPQSSQSLDSNIFQAEVLNKKLIRKIDIRLCTIAGILCSLNLLDSGILSSAAVTSMREDIGLTGDRFSISIFIFTVASICAQLPATIVMRLVGPPIFFGCATVSFGLITLCTAFVRNFREMIVLRVLLGFAMSGIYPGLTYLIAAWYPRRQQQLRFAFLQAGEVTVLATGSIVNSYLNRLNGRHSLAGWQYMFIVQGSISVFLGLLTFVWMPHFPENAHKTAKFLSKDELGVVMDRIEHDRKDAGNPGPFTVKAVAVPFLDPKLYMFAVLFFLLNIVSTALSYFLPIILQSGMGFSENMAIILAAPPYYYAVIPVILSSYFGDRFRVRGPVIIFNATCLIVGFALLGFEDQVAARYVGTFLATGAYVSNWAALSTYVHNNVTGGWKRVSISSAVAACNGLGGIAGSYIVRSNEAPRYMTAIWVSISSHLLMIVLVLVLTLFFWKANRRASRGKSVIEGVDSFRYTY